jgi:hypothetical protein
MKDFKKLKVNRLGLAKNNLAPINQNNNDKNSKVEETEVQKTQVEETFETVAEVEALPSVQLTSSSNGETLNSEEL